MNLVYSINTQSENRKFPVGSATAYRFGYNGKEKDDEVVGEGNCIAYELRIYDTRLGRFSSIDPREKEYPWQSTYAYFANSPVSIIDFNGGGKESTHTDKDGNVLRVYDDGDNGVYKHDDAKNGTDIDKKYIKTPGTTAGGTLMGQTMTWNSFADDKGNALGKIDFSAPNMTPGLNNNGLSYRLKASVDLLDHWAGTSQTLMLANYAANAGNGGAFDIKTNGMPEGLDQAGMDNYMYRGERLKGTNYIVSGRDAGNLLAGMAGNIGGLTKVQTLQAFGAYALIENSVFNIHKTYGSEANKTPPFYGERPQSSMMQNIGFMLTTPVRTMLNSK